MDTHVKEKRFGEISDKIVPEQGEEEQGDQEEEASESCTDSAESSEQDGSPQETICTPLSEDNHQHGLMIGNDYAVDKGQPKKG